MDTVEPNGLGNASLNYERKRYTVSVINGIANVPEATPTPTGYFLLTITPINKTSGEFKKN